jgi:subfamily B ATP-binding cassette protein MsbA
MKKTFQFLYPYLKLNWKKTLLALFLSLPLSGIKGLEVWLVKHIVNSLANFHSWQQPLLLSLSLLLIGMINYPCRFYHFYLIRLVVDRTACLLRQQLYEKIQKLPLSYFQQEKGGSILSQLLNDTQCLAQGLKSVIDLIREPLTAIVMIGMAIYSDWQLTLVIIFVTPLFILIFNKSGKRVRHFQEQIQEHLAEMTHTMQEGISGQKILKAFHLQAYATARFEHIQNAYFHSLMKATKTEEQAHPLVEFVGTLAFAGVILFAHYRISIKAMTTGDFFSFVTALALLMDPIRKFSQANIKINQARAAGSRLWELLKLPEEPQQGTYRKTTFESSIEFQNITFRFEGQEEDVLKNISFKIEKGQKVALVGLSGSGKSTLIHLLLRFYPLQSGKIFIDGVSHEDIFLEDVRQLFGYVGQDIFLFHDSILENITLGRTFTPTIIDQALTISGAKSFIEELPQKEQTIIGDRGTKLSGGQGQRLTIARAFLQQSPIYLFDEATSALDNQSEKIVQSSLDQLAGDKTVLSVAHRLTTIQAYHKIIVMKQGQIIEQGTHQELLNKQQEYAHLYQLGMTLQHSSEHKVNT